MDHGLTDDLEREKRRSELNDIRQVLGTAHGRRVVWRMMGFCRTFSSVWSEDPSKIAYNAGKQDVGHFIMSELTKADESLFLRMMSENREDKNNE